MSRWDVIVVGVGGVGSAVLAQLASRGVSVLGLDRFPPAHAQGSSHGQTRILRQAYFEHPDYTPLLPNCYEHWAELSALVGKQLYHEVGVLQVGPARGVVVPGVLRSAAQHNLAVEQISSAEIERRWPDLHVPQHLVGAYESQAGYLLVEECVQAHLAVARQQGAELRYPVEVQSWQPGPPIRVQTSAGELKADRLIITAGAWANQLLADLGIALEVRRKSMFWYAAQGNQYQATENFPCFLYELPEGVFYGMPQHNARGVKLAEHSGGQNVDDPLKVDRDVLADDQLRIAGFARQYLPAISEQLIDHAACLYTMSPDEHFIVDRHPACDNVLFAAGLSGHGFKFAPVLGQALAELAMDGGTELPIDFLSLGRLQE